MQISPILLSKLSAVLGIYSVVSGGGAGHYDSDCIIAGSLAQDSYKRGVLSAAVSENNAAYMGLLNKLPYEAYSIFKFLFIIPHGVFSFL